MNNRVIPNRHLTALHFASFRCSPPSTEHRQFFRNFTAEWVRDNPNLGHLLALFHRRRAGPPGKAVDAGDAGLPALADRAGAQGPGRTCEIRPLQIDRDPTRLGRVDAMAARHRRPRRGVPRLQLPLAANERRQHQPGGGPHRAASTGQRKRRRRTTSRRWAKWARAWTKPPRSRAAWPSRTSIPPKFILQATIKQMSSFVDQAPMQNPFAAIFTQKVEAIKELSSARRNELRGEAAKIVQTQVYPAWKRGVASWNLNFRIPPMTRACGVSRAERKPTRIS